MFVCYVWYVLDDLDEMISEPTSTEAGQRAQAIARLRARQELRAHLFVYVAVNAMLVAVWASTGGPFWPVFPMAGWGLGLLGHAWLVHWRPVIGEDEIQGEIKRLEDERTR